MACCKPPEEQQCTTFKQCDAWGDPHFTNSFFGASFNFQGLGLFTLAKSTNNDFEVQALQCPYNGGSNAVFVGFAMRKGQSKVTMIGDTVSVTVNGVEQTGTGSLAFEGLSVSNGGSSVSYSSPDDCFNFASTKNDLGGVAPGYYQDMNLEIGGDLASSEGICGSQTGKINVDPSGSLFSSAEATPLCRLCGLADNCARRLSIGRRLTGDADPTPEEVCQTANISHALAASKCQALGSETAYYKGCIYDFCASDGNDAFVTGSVEASGRAKERAQNKTIVSTQTTASPDAPVSSSYRPVSLCFIFLVFLATFKL